MTLIFAKISTLCTWIIFWIFILITKIVNRTGNEQKFIGKSGSISTITIVLFFTVLYTLMWTDETSIKDSLTENWLIFLTFFGFIILMAGLALGIWSVWTLGKSWSASTAAPKNIRLIQNGPYSLVRHPIYLSQMLIWLGSVIMFFNPSGFLLGIAILIPTLKIRVNTEEKNLLVIYDDIYKKYCLRTGSFLPKIR